MGLCQTDATPAQSPIGKTHTSRKVQVLTAIEDIDRHIAEIRRELDKARERIRHCAMDAAVTSDDLLREQHLVFELKTWLERREAIEKTMGKR